jgi:hypothetical protein
MDEKPFLLGGRESGRERVSRTRGASAPIRVTSKTLETEVREVGGETSRRNAKRSSRAKLARKRLKRDPLTADTRYVINNVWL